jgi:hypothetical protein
MEPMSITYEWKRFWCPRGEAIDLSDGGFLYDPESKYGHFVSPHLLTFDQLASKPCLALLGEPGIGKSWVLNAEKVNSDNTAGLPGVKSLWVDLRSFGSEERLWRTLFESDELIQWRSGDHLLYVFLDSLDECLLRIDNVASLIADQLPKEPVTRLRIRITCRTAPWPPILESALVSAFGEDGFEAYELVPLRRRDVQHALEKRGIPDTDSFFTRVEALDVSSFAIKPVTLNFLINTYLRDGNLPANQIDLYESGCRILCEESNESRVASGKRGCLTVEDRFAIASRIAAVTQFCNRFSVWTGSEATIPPEDVSVNSMVGSEQLEAADLAVSPDAVREVLDTGLFSSRGPSRIGWAHQTYAEFLAARYCIRNDMPTKQVQSLIFHPAGGGQRLVPQMYDVAGWISVMNPEILKLVASADPESLLGAAGASLSEVQRELVVQSLLEQSESGRLLSLRWSLYQLYPKLGHSRLSEQLRLYLRDSTKKLNTRQVSVDIARACRVEELGPDLADIALDANEESVLRIPAGAAAANIGSSDVKFRLRPLAFGQAGDDPDDELRGIGLTAMWPDWINSTELFSLLTRPKNRQLHGAYTSFLYHLTSQLGIGDLPAALEWFAGQLHRDMGPIDRLMDDIIRLAIRNLEVPGVLGGTTKAILSRVKMHDRLMSGHDRGELVEDLRSDHISRQMLLQELLPQVTDNELFFLEYAGMTVVPEVDLPWLIRRLEVKSSGTSEHVEVKLIRRIIDTRQTDQMQLLWIACQTNALLKAECEDLFVIPLDSESVRILREDLQRQQNQQKKLLDPPPQTRIEQDLANIENGKILEWVRLTRDLSLKPTSTDWEDIDSPDLTALPGWISSTDEVKERIEDAAFRYANAGEPENDKWWGTSETYFSAIAGFQALGLLLRVAPKKLHDLSNPVWRKWIPILLKYPHTGADGAELQSILLTTAHSHAPDEVITRLMQMIDHDNKHHGYLFVSREIDVCWDGELAAALLTKATEPHLKPSVVSSLLQALLMHHTSGSRELAKSFIIVPPPDTEPQKTLMVGVIEATLSGAQDAGWCDIWPIIRDYPEFGRSLIGSVSYAHAGAADFLQKLTDEQLGEFYVWMLVNYPPSPLDHRSSGAVGPSQTAVMLRDHTLEHLKKRATFEASESIRQALTRLPQYPWLGLHLEQAQSLARAASWQPISPRQLLTLTFNHQKRLVDTTEQLVGIVFESLDRLQSKLNGELPASKDLWNADRGQYWPKDEEDFSDYVARHLDEDIQHRGVIVNREVQIRRGVGSGTGQFTDINVDAVAAGTKSNTYSRLYLIIEAKGNWNRELFENMKTQLRDRYLKENRCQSGIYLIGWFSCIKWKEQDPRKLQCSRMSIVEARKKFSQQAVELSKDGFQIKSYVLDLSLG